MSDRNDKNAAKKAAVLGGKKKGPVPFLLMAACAVLVIGGGVLFMGQSKDQSPPIAQVFQPEAAQAADLTYPVAEFDDGTARFFGHQTADGVQVRFFVLKSSDGVIRSAFDACDSCWTAGKGYRQAGDEMVCQNCRMRFASVKVMEVKGGCNPSPLPNKVENGQVVIRVQDVEAGAAYFQPRQEG
ncbi:MAG TPA: DUF2318 domain-containing protein [Deferrisomatales bacterium]|nr:DUF2318 domain-containing protein [Deferrisomatales bacterium]